jgi:hypothetical protein
MRTGKQRLPRIRYTGDAQVRKGVKRCTWVRMRGSGPFELLSIGYLFKQGNTHWRSNSYTSTEPLISNACHPKTANTTIAMTSTEFANPSYVLGYICTWTGRAWKYGYRDSACTQS